MNMLRKLQEGHIASIHVSQELSGRHARQPRWELLEGSWTCSPTFSQTLLNLGAIVAYDERKTEVAHLAEVAIPCIMVWRNGREIEVEESRKSRGISYRIGSERSVYRERLLTSVRLETGHCSLWVAISLDISVPEYAHTLRYGLPDIFNVRNFHRVYHRSVRRDYVWENARSRPQKRSI